MSYPDFTATLLTGTATIPAAATVTRRVATTYSLGVMQATSAGLASPSDIPYPMVQNVVFTDLGGGSFGITGSARSITVAGAYKTRADKLGSLVGFFDIAADGTWGPIVDSDGTPADWTFTIIRLSDDQLFVPGWTAAAPDTAASWLFSTTYAIREQRQIVEVPYPVTSPAQGWFTATFPICHIDGSGNLVVTVNPDPDGSTAEVRAYTLWDVVNGVAIGPPTYVNVPNRRVVSIGDQTSGVRMDVLTLQPLPYWNDTLPVASDQTFSVSISAGTQAELTLVRESDLAFLARASMTTQFPREFFFYAGDTDRLDNGTLAYGSDFEEVAFPPYASSVVGIAYLTLLAAGRLTAAQTTVAQNAVRYIAMGLARIVRPGGPIPGGTPFGWGQRYGGTGPSTEYYRTGTIAWGAYFLYETLLRLPSGMWSGAYATWKTTIETAAADVLTWCHGQDDATGLCRFGTGRIDPSTLLFDPSYQFTFHAQEHNSDLVFAELAGFAYTGNATLHTKAADRVQAMVDLLWDDTNGRLYQSCDQFGVPDGVASLDCYSWGGLALNAGGHTDKAVRAMPRTDYYRFTSTAGAGTKAPAATVRGLKNFADQDGILDYAPSVWVEGTCGVLAAKQRLGLYTTEDQSIYAGLPGLQQFDGSYRNYQLNDPDPFGITNFRSCQAAAWTIIARYPNLVWWTQTI